jgi:hypothetical protein
MYVPPLLQQLCLRILDCLQGAPFLRVIHSGAPDEFWTTVTANENDLRLAVATDMHVRRLVIIYEDEEAQAMRAQHYDHGAK